MTEPDTTSPTTAHARPRRGIVRIAIITAGLALVLVAAFVVVRIVLAPPSLPLGETPAASLVPGACLAEPTAALATYTVVDCGSPHPAQVVAEVDLERGAKIYSDYAVVEAFAEEVCDRYFEYRLFVSDAVTTDEHDLVVVGYPDEEQYAAGSHSAFCAVVALDGSDLPTGLYRALP